MAPSRGVGTGASGAVRALVMTAPDGFARQGKRAARLRMIDAMNSWLLLADLVLCLHVALMLFVVLGLPLIIAGNLRHRPWINSAWLRFAHLTTIVVVATEAWAGIVCPLTTLEMFLRARAGGATYAGSFVEHWLQALLFWPAPPWVFTTVYTMFGATVLATWLLWPVRSWWPRSTARGRAGR